MFPSMGLPIALAAFNFLGQERTNDRNEDMAANQMAFQERMSSTSYQRAVADMQAAGLNPMLAYSQGGASAPMGAMPQVQNSAASATAAAAQAASIANIQADTELKQATAYKTREETVTNESDNLTSSEVRVRIRNLMQQLVTEEQRAPNLRAETGLKEKDQILRELQAELAKLSIPGAKAEADYWKSDIGSNLPKPVMELLNFLKGVLGHGARSIAK